MNNKLTRSNFCHLREGRIQWAIFYVSERMSYTCEWVSEQAGHNLGAQPCKRTTGNCRKSITASFLTNAFHQTQVGRRVIPLYIWCDFDWWIRLFAIRWFKVIFKMKVENTLCVNVIPSWLWKWIPSPKARKARSRYGLTCISYIDDRSGIDNQNHRIWYRYVSKMCFPENVLAEHFIKGALKSKMAAICARSSNKLITFLTE